MEIEQYLAGIRELYQGEVLGEGLTSQLLAICADEEKFVVSLLLQVESEAKVRLRPFLFKLGISVQEDESMREAGVAFAATLKDVPWRTAVAELAELSKPYLERYRLLEAAAPAADLEHVSYMVAHEQAIVDYFELEACGKGQDGIAGLQALLHYPLPLASC